MIINTLEPINIIMANIYLIMLLQIAFNWDASNCSTNSNVFQIIFILTLVVRLIIQEAKCNKIISKKTAKALMLFSSGALLTGLGVYESYSLSKNW